MDVSVIVCTYNPDLSFLGRVLSGLEHQTLGLEHFEVLVVDNNSDPPIASFFESGLPRNWRLVREEEPGLTLARLRGISEAESDLLTFVDDDAILDEEYLLNAVTISKAFPFVGAYGGSIELEFQERPPEWTRPHWPRLAQREVKRTVWSNFDCASQTIPWGVGMCIRREVADRYAKVVDPDPLRKGLDRCGASLVSGGDDDMARTAHTMGLATGLFPELKLTHLIPPLRLTEDYLLRLVEGQSYSGVIVDHLHQSTRAIREISILRGLIGQMRRKLFMPSRTRKFLEARIRGEQKAIRAVMEMEKHH